MLTTNHKEDKMERMCDSTFYEQLSVKEETLSDGSKVYNVYIGSYKIPVRSYDIACDLLTDIIKSVQKYEAFTTVRA
jgi:hypothetical protein